MMNKLPKEFQAVYRYKVVGGNITQKKELNHPLWDERGVVYANVCNGKVVRIGKTDGYLRTRILAHVNYYFPARKNPKYIEHVDGKTVTIFAYKPKAVRLFGIDVPIHTSVEAALIGQFKRPGPWFGYRI